MIRTSSVYVVKVEGNSRFLLPRLALTLGLTKILYAAAPRYTYGMSRRHFLGDKQVRVREGSHRATRCACIRGARGDTARACGTSSTPPSAVRSARCARARASPQASTAAPEEVHRSATTPRPGTTRWAHTRGETTPSLHSSSWCDARPAVRFSPPGNGLAALDARLKSLIW